MSYHVKQRIILVIALLSYFLTALSNSIVITGLTKIAADLSMNQITLSWVQNAYGLAFGSFLLLSGRLSDALSRRTVLSVALVIFMVGSFLAGLAPTGTIMIAARFLQGIGSALLAPTSMALLVDYFEGPALVKAIAWYSSISGLGSSVGLVLGGVLASYWSWRVGFYLNAPVCLLMLVLTTKVLPKAAPRSERFDVVGTISSVLGCGLLVYSLTGASRVGLTLTIAIMILAAFIFIEKYRINPILPLGIFKNRIRSMAYLNRTILNGTIMGYWFFISEYLQQVYHYSPLVTGFAYLPISLTMFLAAVIVPRLITHWHNKWTFLVAVNIVLIGFIWALLITDQGYWLSVGIPMLILGCGQGLALAPNTNMGLTNVDEANTGVASGLINTAHQLGGVLGLALFVNLSSSLVSSHHIAAEFHVAMIAAVVMAVIVVVLAWFSPNTDQ